MNTVSCWILLIQEEEILNTWPLPQTAKYSEPQPKEALSISVFFSRWRVMEPSSCCDHLLGRKVGARLFSLIREKTFSEQPQWGLAVIHGELFIVIMSM